MRKRLLITGEMRSGTTLLARLVGAHPDAEILIDDILEIREPSANLSTFGARGLRLISLNGRSVVGHKVTVAHKAVSGILSLGANERVLYIYRDPRAVVASFLAFRPIYHRQLLKRSLSWRDSWRTMSAIWHDERVMFVWFEGLVGSGREELDAIYQWLELSPHDPAEEWLDDNSSFASTKGVIDRGSLLTPWQTAVVESVTWDEMIDAGYRATRYRSPLERWLVRQIARLDWR